MNLQLSKSVSTKFFGLIERFLQFIEVKVKIEKFCFKYCKANPSCSSQSGKSYCRTFVFISKVYTWDYKIVWCFGRWICRDGMLNSPHIRFMNLFIIDFGFDYYTLIVLSLNAIFTTLICGLHKWYPDWSSGHIFSQQPSN